MSSKFRSRLFLTLFFSLVFFSCADNEADVVSATGTMIFDFKDEESSPESRLAVFLQVTNDVQRTDNFTISHEKSGYLWNIAKPGIFTGLNKKYAFSLNLTAPLGSKIPQGAYSVKYFDAAGKDDETVFSVNYDEKLLKSNAKDFKELLTNPQENVAVYDDSGELLFMGKAKNNWKTNADILKDYRIAWTKRICYVTPGNTIICMMPEEKLKVEN